MRIPVFVSCPTTLSPDQEDKRKLVDSFLDDFEFEPRALGRSDYPTELPLREVLVIARHCAGGVVLGFEQILLQRGVVKRGQPDEQRITRPTPYPTPWNHLEAGILFGIGLPILIFREEDVRGGVFDKGVSDVFVHEMPDSSTPRDQLKAVFLKWQARVYDYYYRPPSG